MPSTANSCPVCRSENVRNTYAELGVFGCATCGHVYRILAAGRGEEYADEYYEEKHKNWFDNPDHALFDFIYSHTLRLRTAEPVTLLDLGCGNGTFLKHLLALEPEAKLVGIDLKDNRHPGIEFIRADALEYEFPGRFDCVVSLAVLEHVADPNGFMARIDRVLAADGLLAVMTVDSHSLLYDLARILNRVGASAAFERLFEKHHLQHFSGRSLRTLLERNGFDILVHEQHNPPVRAAGYPTDRPLMIPIYKLALHAVFGATNLLGSGYLQTAICKRHDAPDWR
jgi:SAM-dependent methyltransferase